MAVRQAEHDEGNPHRPEYYALSRTERGELDRRDLQLLAEERGDDQHQAHHESGDGD
jgi:hypothetical protein